MDIAKKKLEILETLAEVLADIELLKEHINEYVTDMAEVKTEDDAKFFELTHDLEDGLKHISLF